MCKNKTESKTLYVRDALNSNVKKMCEFDSMRKTGRLFAKGVAAIPIVDYSGKLVGSLVERDSIQFLNSYFENLITEDRGNEFLLEQEAETDIHFVPIDQISRYMRAVEGNEQQVISVGQTLEKAETVLCEQNRTAALVYDGDEIVGSISLNGIALSRQRAKAACCQNCQPQKASVESYSL